MKRFAGSKDANAFKNLADFLGKATAMKDVPLALEILKKMGETTLVRVGSYSWNNRMTGEAGGLSTQARKEAVLGALRAFEWRDLMDVVLGLIAKTGEGDLEHAAALAMALKVWIHHKAKSKTSVENIYIQVGENLLLAWL